MSSPPKERYTPEQYLEKERKADYKSEYVSGEILAMAGASREHNRITLNIGTALTVQLRETACEPFMADLRVRVRSTGAYFYPDSVVACGRLELEDSHRDTLLNPTVIMEVLSPSTEANDRGWKFAHYRRIETLTDYILVSQDRPLVEHYARQGEGEWLLKVIDGIDGRLSLPSTDCELSLSGIYSRVTFPTQLQVTDDHADNNRA